LSGEFKEFSGEWVNGDPAGARQVGILPQVSGCHALKEILKSLVKRVAYMDNLIQRTNSCP